MKDADILPNFVTVRESSWPSKKKAREIKKYDDTIEPNVIKIRNFSNKKNKNDFDTHYELDKHCSFFFGLDQMCEKLEKLGYTLAVEEDMK